jgi:DNA-binding NtrC family response regulator
VTYKEARQLWEMEYWSQAIATYGTVQKVAKAVGVDRKAIYSRMKRMGISPPHKYRPNWGNLSDVEPKQTWEK